MNGEFSWEHFRAFPVVGILRGFPAAVLEQVAAAVKEGGLHNLEMTMNTDNAPELIRLLRAHAGDAMNIGAGTVCTMAGLDAALGAGAQFIVMPVVVPEVIKACRERGVPVCPGAFTPTEIYRARELGADLVKVFPADQLGPAFVRSMRGPLPEIPLMPTGGVTLESVGAYRRAGAAAYGVGGPLFAKERVAAGDWAWIAEQVRRFRRALEEG